MDSSALERVAALGLEGGVDLAGLAVECFDHAEATGDARYASLAKTFELIAAWQADHEEDGVPDDVWDELDALLRWWLPGILELGEPADASTSARVLREEVTARVTP